MIKERKLNLFYLLLDSKNFITAKELADKLNVSAKTIYKDITEIEAVLNDQGAKIIKKPRCGVRLQCEASKVIKVRNQIFNAYSQHKSDNLSPDLRRKELFRNLFINSKNISLQKTAEKYYVSKTAILKDIDYIQRNVKDQNVEVVTEKKLLKLSGKENDIQVAALSFIINNFLSDDDYNWDALKSIFADIFENVRKIYDSEKNIWFVGESDYYELPLFISILIQVARVIRGHHFPKMNHKIFEKFDYMQLYPIASDFLDTVKKRMGICFSETDKEALSKQLFAYKVNSPKENSKFWKQTTDLLIDRLEMIEGIKINNRKELNGQLLSHIPPMILRLSKGITISNPLVDEIKTRNVTLFAVTWYVLSFVEEQFGVTLNNDEVSFVMLYFQMALNKATPTHRVLIICPYGIISSRFIVNQLRQILPKNDEIQSVSVSKLGEINLKQVDMIISTTHLLLDTNIPVVRVTPFLDKADYAKVLDVYQRRFFTGKTQMQKFSLDNLTFPKLKNYLNKSNIFLNPLLDSKDDALNFLADQFEKKEYVTTEFRESLINREKIGNTALESGAALPHASPDTSKRLAIAIIILEKPIKWSDQWVSVIVALSVPERQIDLYRDLVLDIYRLIGNRKTVEELKNIRSPTELITLVNRI